MIQPSAGVRSALAALWIAAALGAQERPEAKIDAIFQAWNNASGPGAAVAVIQQGKVVFEKGYGRANLEYEVPIQPETIFHVASVSKQFTAFALVLLERDGKLSVDDAIHKYLPELPDYGRPITIRNLLQHTSGIRDQWQTLGIAGWSMEDVITQEQILRLLFRQKQLNFDPGTEHLYSNGGYTLAAEIVARVSGKPFPEFCAERIFKPLGMSHTHFHMDLHQIVKNRAYSYSGTAGAYSAAPLNYANAGATSLFTTATDLVKWLDNFREPKVGGAAAVARLREQAVLISGKKIDYALGVSVGEFRGLKTVSHSGGDAGFRSYVAWYPEQQFGVAVVSNLGNFNPAAIANKVAAVFLESKMSAEVVKPAAPARTYVAVNAETLKNFAGVYPLPKIGQTLVAVAEGGKLLAAGPIQPPMEMKPLSESSFYVEQISAEVQFEPTAGGGMRVKLTKPGGVTEGERSTDPPQTAKDLESYAGSYWSEELETQYTFTVRDGKLTATHAHHGNFVLTPGAKDTFSANKWFAPQVKFARDQEGRVNAVNLGGGRLRGIRFVRK